MSSQLSRKKKKNYLVRSFCFSFFFEGILKKKVGTDGKCADYGGKAEDIAGRRRWRQTNWPSDIRRRQGCGHDKSKRGGTVGGQLIVETS